MSFQDHSSQSTSASLAALHWVQSAAGQAELAALAARLPLTPKEIIKIRERHGEERAKMLLELVPQHWAVAEKLGRTGCLATNRGLQQATDHWIARYKANRLPRGAVVYDVCCGIGGDAMAMAARGPLVGIDRDPLMCHIAAHNVALAGGTEARFQCTEAATMSLSSDAWLHLDPDRRTDQGRASTPDFCSPPTHVIDTLLEQSAGAVVKLAPAAEVPQRWQATACEREWISRAGVCRQQAIWFRREPSTPAQAATRLLQSGEFCSLRCSREERLDSRVATVHEPSRWLFDWDPAVRAAGLSELLGLRLAAQSIGGPAGFFTAAEPPASDFPWNPLVASFRVLWLGALDGKQLRRTLKTLDPASLEIKVRGLEVSPESLRKELLPQRSAGAAKHSQPSLTLLVGRIRADRAARGKPTFAALAERMASGESTAADERV
jgi:hypothetical protein